MTDFEVVIPDSAYEFDNFVEHFDQQIKYSNLKRAAKIAQTEWDLSGGILSKGRVNIYRSANNIIVRVKSEIDIVPIILIIILSLLIGIIFLVIASDNQKKIDSEVRRAIESAKTKILMETRTKTVSIPILDKEKIMDCPGCGEALYEEANFCPYCGFKLENCIVCNRIIGKEDEITKCLHCSGLAHRDHLLEYIKVKGRCPNCGKGLKKYELV
ncbi:MAG: zinc-ribbon domain-containing protein [Candidatus Lokiarchaeia archaeon]